MRERSDIKNNKENIKRQNSRAQDHKWIEECLPQEYKRQYTKSKPSSLSKQKPVQIIEVSTEGKQVSQEQQDDDKVIDRSTEGQPSNKIRHAMTTNRSSKMTYSRQLMTLKQLKKTMTL